MGLIRFLIEKYNLKEFFSYELKLIGLIKTFSIYLFFNYSNVFFRLRLVLEFIILLFTFFVFSKYFVILFFLLIIKNYFKLSFKHIKHVYYFLLSLNYKNVLFILKIKFYKFKYKFFVLYFKLFKFFYSIKFFSSFSKIILFHFVFFSSFLLKFIKFFLKKKNSLMDDFFFKFFFNFEDPSDVNRFMLLFNTSFNYYILMPFKAIHYKLMSIPMENPQFGNVQPAWLVYAAPITFYFFLVRWNYPTSLEKKFKARYYYREKAVVSFLKNFFFIFFYFFDSFKYVCIWIYKKLYFYLSFLIASNYYLKINFVLLRKKKNLIFFIYLFTRISILLVFICVFFFFGSFFKIFLPNIVYSFFKIVEKPARAYDLIFLFFYKLKLKIIDRIVFVPKFLSFGRGVRFLRRFKYKDFMFVINFHYWMKRDFTGRFQLFLKFKNICTKKRNAGFQLFFRSFFLLKYFIYFFKFFFLIVDYIIFYPIFWIFLKILWSLCADLCFVF